MARIPAVSPGEAGPLIRLSYWYAKRRFGEVPEPFAVSANHNKLFMSHLIAETAAGRASKVLPTSVRDLAVYRVAWTVGCSWCIDFGTMLARLEGLDADGGYRRAGRRSGAPFRTRWRSGVDLPDRVGEPALTDELVARYHRAGLQLRRRLPPRPMGHRNVNADLMPES